MRTHHLAVMALVAGFLAACNTMDSDVTTTGSTAAPATQTAAADSSVQVPDGTWVTPDGDTTIRFSGNQPRSYFHAPANYRPSAGELRRSGDVVQVGAGRLTITGVSNGQMSGVWRMGGTSGSRTYILQ